MAENELIVTAGLNFEASEALIVKQLEKIQNNFNNKGGLQINCTINDAAIKQLQTNLESISKNLTIGIDSNTLQQSINQAVKSEPIKVNVEADIKSGELKRQAKEFKEMWKIGFTGESKENVKALNAQLREMLAEYDKAMKAQDQKGFEESWQKLTDFVNEYINTIKVLTPEAQKLNSILSKTKVLIGYDSTDYANLKTAYGDQTKMTEVLHSVLGVGNWSYIKGKASYGFDSLVRELNSSLFKDADKISEHIVEGLEKIATIRNSGQAAMEEWVKSEEQALSQDSSYWEARKDAVLDSLYTIRNEVNPAKMGWTEILSDEDIQQGQEKIRAYTEVLKEGKRKIEALKTQIKAEGGDEIKAISSRFTSDAAGNLDGFVLAVQKSNGEVENLYHKLKETEDETGNLVREWERVRITGSDSGIDKVLDRAVKSADALSRKMNNLYAGATDQNAARPIKTEAGRNAIADAYNRAVEAVNALRNANALTFAEMDNEAKVAIDNLNNVIKMQRNAETAATKLRTKSVTEIKSEELLNLDQFVTTITDSAIPNVEHLKQEVENLRTQLQQVGAEDKQGLINYLIAFSNLDEEFKTLNAEAKSVKKSLSDLDKIAGNTQFKNNATNESVVAQQANIEALRNKYLALFEEIGKANTPQALQAISTQLSELKPEFDSVTQSAIQLQNTLKADDSEAKLAAKINNLKNQVEIFASTNRKATESLKQMRNGMTFADEWQRIISQLRSGNLDENAIRRLTEDLKNFKGEAQSAGLTVNRFFQNMSSQLKMVAQRWLSLYAIIGRITTALNDLKSVDKILTEIAKSSDVTRESLESLGNAAFDTASKYGRLATDYLYGVQEFSRAGFRGEQLAGLTEVSLLAQAAGDIETDLANSYVIATNAAYNYLGSQEKLNEVLDRQNYVTNNYALNMTDLANATKIAASQAAQSGVEIDQMTAALATMISTTQQGGEIAARSLRGILMNIQQVKGEVGDGEEDITAESLTKYEKAAKDLGVALKEVKDGVAVLRDPMAVLNDLAEAFNKEADDSIKKANLINAIGGKYRGNQLAALLSNWETYKDILKDFNSDEALGSAVRESQKDVASWTGQVNILKNNWDAFINSIINSDTAINTLKALNGVLEALKFSSKGLGGLGTLSTVIAGIAGIKGSGILTSIQQYQSISRQISGITLGDVAALRQYNALLSQGASVAQAEATALNNASVSAVQLAKNANGAAVSEELLMQAQTRLTASTRTATVVTKAFGTALNVAFNMGVVMLISAAINGITKLIKNRVEAEKIAAEQAEETRQKSLEAIQSFKEEENVIKDVALQYAQMAISTEDLTTKKDELLQLENQLSDGYEKEASGIDLVNGSISENLRLLDEQKRKKAEQYIQDNQGGYEQAAIANGMGFLKVGDTLKRKDRKVLDELAQRYNIRGYDSATGTIGGTLEGRIAKYKELRDLYAQEKDHKSDVLAQIDAEIAGYEKIFKENKSIIDEMEKQKAIISITAQEYNMIEQATVAYAAYQKAVTAEDTQGAYDALNILKGIKSIVYSTSEAGSAFREEFDTTWESFNLGAAESLTKLDEIQERFNNLLDNSFKDEMGNLGKIEDAINSIMEGETLSHDDAWELLGLDTDGILRDIKLIDGQFKFSTEELLQLAQQRINKQKEEINGLKEAAEIQMANYKIQLESMKVSDYDDIKSYAIAIDSIHEDMEATQKVITQCNYLLGEADGKLAKLQATSSDIVKELNNSISAFENEVKAIENTIDSLNDRKDILEAEKDALQEELDILNEQKETLEETLKNYDAVADAVNDYVKSQTDGIQEQIDALEEERKAIEDYYNDQIDALKEQNEERDDAIKKEKALADLANAENQKRRVYSSARGWTYETSKEDIVQAQNALAEIETNEKIKALEKERDAKLGGFDERKEEYETQIEAFEEYAKKYADVASDIQKAENELLADQILGSEWRTKIEQQDETLLNNYRSEYQRFNNDLKTLVKDEIANLQASIDKKDEEIKKIDKQIEAYNRYKNTVETKLSEAKTTLENYKKDVVTYCDDMAKGFENMENRIWEKHNRIIQWFREVYEAAEGLENKMAGSGIAHGAMYLAGLGSFANGGTIDYTGLAMVHGSKSNSETAFNATDSKKLYDMVHNTPNLIASIVKQSGQLGGFNPSNITNRNSTNNSSINVNIGQVVANNPAELTRNLDTHLDGYFRRKLTQGYAQ